MLVNLDSFGRLGNRLFLDAHLSAFCWKHGITLRNVAMDEYSAAFPVLKALARSSLMLRVRSYLPGARHFGYWEERDLDFDQSDVETLLSPLLRDETVFFHGWKFRGFDSVERFRDRILEKYQPDLATTSSASEVVGAARQSTEIVIGVHVRWEDYRGTEFFLSQQEYLKQMQALVNLFSPRSISFLVFSSERVDPRGFDPLPVNLRQGGPVEDLYTMARCDYLIAPPSTFSGWASFYGGVPLAILRKQASPLTLGDFSVVKG